MRQGQGKPFHAHVQREPFLVTLACMYLVMKPPLPPFPLFYIDFFPSFVVRHPNSPRHCLQETLLPLTPTPQPFPPSTPLIYLPLPRPSVYITLSSSTLLPQFHPTTHPPISLCLSLMASAIRARFMEEIMSQQACERPATLALRKDSHMISKMKPKVRIVHIFAPEVIKTDVENFRELVQRLTGKPTKRNYGGEKKAAPARVDSTETNQDSWGGEMVKGEPEEERGELWMEGMSSGGGFLSGFCDVDGIFQGLSDFPLLP